MLVNFRAIINNPVIPTYFTNRALCYMQTMQWEKAEDDCKKALDLDRKNVKVTPHYFFFIRKFDRFAVARIMTA